MDNFVRQIVSFVIMYTGSSDTKNCPHCYHTGKVTQTDKTVSCLTALHTVGRFTSNVNEAK